MLHSVEQKCVRSAWILAALVLLYLVLRGCLGAWHNGTVVQNLGSIQISVHGEVPDSTAVPRLVRLRQFVHQREGFSAGNCLARGAVAGPTVQRYNRCRVLVLGTTVQGSGDLSNDLLHMHLVALLGRSCRLLLNLLLEHWLLNLLSQTDFSFE